MAKFPKKIKVLDPLTIELDEYEVSYLFIKKSDDPLFKDVLESLDHQIPRASYEYHCEDEKEKELIQNYLTFY